ncbi:ATP-binding cassette domain-containing protein [Alteromonas pelagimontana]|uniref:ATP-binding cassette domain-containing protein n=1 Tax=Alteromonas pelagimontana TaxID=1858656 RepID=A0A6M4M9G1_9ALTE|nr:ATP-binding cassette domain-containing protein [Alteromonas pelagimontana]QJR79794.1 ATP-binding cassette domain-containing protein [Alteromonas pelagimontana]
MSYAMALSDITLATRLRGISLHLHAGVCTHILGANGAGKSSLLLILAGLCKADSGAFLLDGKTIAEFGLAELAGFRGFHQQQTHILFELTARELFQFYANRNAGDDYLPAELEQALEVSHLLPRPLNQLSGGEQQRVNLCRAFLQVWSAVERGRAVLIFDEPLQGLDIRHQHALLILCRRLSAAGNTIVLSCHDLQLSAQYADQVVLLKKGKVVSAGAPLSVMTSAMLQQVFDFPFEVKKYQGIMHISAGTRKETT